MFCKNCGVELSKDEKFCHNCGSPKSDGASVKANVEENKLMLKIKPKFDYGYKFLESFGVVLSLTVVIIFFMGSVVEYIITNGVVMFVLGAWIVLYTAFKMWFGKMQYKNLEYNFYTNKLEYQDIFLNKEVKELKYSSIREVTMSQNILERMFNLGTIRLHTNASNNSYNLNKHSNMNGNGVIIHCLENPTVYYKKVKEIIDQED